MALNIPNNPRLKDEDLWTDVGASGNEVEHYLKTRLAEPFLAVRKGNTTISFVSTASGEEFTDIDIAEMNVSPIYNHSVNIQSINVLGQVYTGGNPIIVNGTGVSQATLSYLFTSTQDIAGNVKPYNGRLSVEIGFLRNKTDENFMTTSKVIRRTLEPDNSDTPQPKEIDIAELFVDNGVEEGYIALKFTLNNEETPIIVSYDGLFTIKTYTIHYTGSHVVTASPTISLKTNQDSGVIEYKIKNKNNNGGTSSFVDIGSSQSANITLSEGLNYIVARCINERTNTPVLYSNWLPFAVIYLQEDSQATVSISNIAPSIIDCSSSKLFDIITTDKLQGEADIYVFKSNKLDDILGIDSDNYLNDRYKNLLFKTIHQVLYADTPGDSYPYSLFIENGQSGAIYLKFIIVSGGEALLFSAYDKEGTLNEIFEITVSDAPYNEYKELMHTTDSKVEDFSQITLGTLFDNVNPNLDDSDGFKYDETHTYFKVSPIVGGLFGNGGKILKSLGGQPFTNKFSIEFMIKTYNISNPDDEIFHIGNIKVYPTYLRVETGADVSLSSIPEQELINASRADFASDELTHIIITYDANYKPSTYDYDLLYSNFSSENISTPCLKIYINGTINRVVCGETVNTIFKNFDFEVNPTSSNVNFYIFRTYAKCLSYQEVEKNRLSSITSKKEKDDYFVSNDIYYRVSDRVDPSLQGQISLAKCLGTYTNNLRTYHPRNTILYVVDDINEVQGGSKKYSRTSTPLFYGAKSVKMQQASILVKYADPAAKDNCGRLFPDPSKIAKDEEYYKGQGSSSKKYGGAWNVQYAKFLFQKEDNFGLSTAKADGFVDSFYRMPGEDYKILKTCGKVNYASSMQSHKQGACKLYNNLYKQIVDKNNEIPYRKAVNEDQFFYFWIKLSDCNPGTTLENVTWNDFDPNKAHFFGFQTWGSAKGDKDSFGYSDRNYAVFEGADNKNPCANFKAPWAAQQMWNPTKTGNILEKERQNNEASFGFYDNAVWNETKISDDYYLQNSGWNSAQNKPDYLTGLYIWDETIQYRNKFSSNETKNSTETNPDSWDLSGFITDPDDNPNKQCFIKEGKEKYLNKFAEFYNYIYLFDAASLESLGNKSSSVDFSKLDKSKKYISEGTVNYGELSLGVGDVIRYDYINEKWVEAGLYYIDNSWLKLNIVDFYNTLKNTVNGTVTEYTTLLNWDCITGGSINKNYFTYNITKTNYLTQSNNSLLSIKRALGDFFKCTMKKYTKVEDFTFHLAMMRTLSGTDNRAKNVYYVMYDDGPIELFLDDLDTIFKTDNNGLQVKPYNLLEPPYNKDTISMWGDAFSGLFTNFDILYENWGGDYSIKNMLSEILSKIKAGDLMENYFFSIQKYFPAISYNHTSELWYEVMQLVYNRGNGNPSLTTYGNKLGWENFSNNQVVNPVSLSHGSCIEAERQFLKDRLSLLGTYTGSGYNTEGTAIGVSLPTGSGNEDTVEIKATNVSYNKFTYPEFLNTKLNHQEVGENFPVNPIDDVLNPRLYNESITNYVNSLAGLDGNYSFISTTSAESVLTGGGGKINNTDLIRTITIEKGLNFLGNLNFPNAEEVTIDASEQGFKLMRDEGKDSIDMAKQLGCIKKLILKAVTFDADYVKFTDCSRLEELDLSDVTTIQNLTLPESNKLRKLIIPSNLNLLIIKHYPFLLNVEFTGDSTISNLIIDARNVFINSLIENYVSDQPVKIQIDNNINGITLSRKSLEKLLKALTLILSGIVHIDGNVDWILKERLAAKFGNIDSEANAINSIYCTYNHVTATSISCDSEITVGLGLTSRDYNLKIIGEDDKDANDMTIDSNGRLNIRYTKSGSYKSDFTFNTTSGNNDTSYTGYITVSPQTNVDGRNVDIKIKYGSLPEQTCKVTAGFREPKLGDFVKLSENGNTIFTSMYDPDKSFGYVYYVNQVGDSYNVDIMSLEAIPMLESYNGNTYRNILRYATTETTGNELWNIYRSRCNTSILFLNPEVNNAYWTTTITYDAANKAITPTSYETTAIVNDAHLIQAIKNYKALATGTGSVNDSPEYVTKETFSNFAKTLINQGHPDYILLIFPAYIKVASYVPSKIVEYPDSIFYTKRWNIPTSWTVAYLINQILESVNVTATDSGEYWKKDSGFVNPYGLFGIIQSNNGNCNMIGWLGDSPKITCERANNYSDNILYNKAYHEYTSYSNGTNTYHYTFEYSTGTGNNGIAYNLPQTSSHIYPCITITVNRND